MTIIVDDLERITAPSEYDAFASPRWADPDVHLRGYPTGPDDGVVTPPALRRALGKGVAAVDGGTRIGDPS